MSRMNTRAAGMIFAALVVTLSPDTKAQGLLDSVSGLAAGGGLEAGSIKGPMAMNVITNKLQQAGYTNISDLSPSATSGLLQATATTSTGLPVNLLIDPLTGSIVSALPK